MFIATLNFDTKLSICAEHAIIDQIADRMAVDAVDSVSHFETGFGAGAAWFNLADFDHGIAVNPKAINAEYLT